MTDKALRRLYLKLNVDWFYGELPTKSTTLSFVDSKESGRWIYRADETFDIHVASDLRGRPWAVAMALLHEMIHMDCHLQGWEDHLDHGPSFRDIAQGLLARGAFDEYI